MTESASTEKSITPGKYLAFDPGLSTGWALFGSTGEVESKGIIRGLDALMDFLQEFSGRPAVVICEDYRIFQKKAMAHTGSRVETVQAIGMIKVYAKKWGSELELQPSSILSIAQLWSGVKLPANHDKSHDISAYNHGVYYLQKNKIRKSRLLK